MNNPTKGYCEVDAVTFLEVVSGRVPIREFDPEPNGCCGPRYVGVEFSDGFRAIVESRIFSGGNDEGVNTEYEPPAFYVKPGN
jgi:hypothetical protein